MAGHGLHVAKFEFTVQSVDDQRICESLKLFFDDAANIFPDLVANKRSLSLCYVVRERDIYAELNGTIKKLVKRFHLFYKSALNSRRCI